MLVTGFGGSLLLWLLSLLQQDRVDVCHVTGLGRVIEVRVGGAAAAALLRHGDYLPIAFYADNDGDGYGDAYDETLACEAPVRTVANDVDCDDSAAFVNPFAVDTCGDSVDEDCSGDDALCSTESGGWTATAGRVVPGATPGTLSGTYTFARISDSASSVRGGGACLVADLFAYDPSLKDFTCTSDAACPAPADLIAAGGTRYCASPDGSGEPKRCWTRPTDNCSRSPFRTAGEYVVNSKLTATPSIDSPTTPGSEVPKDAPVKADATGQGKTVRWMVITCLATSPGMGCGSPDPSLHVYSYGPVYTWTASL